jgi:hypothetical protein
LDTSERALMWAPLFPKIMHLFRFTLRMKQLSALRLAIQGAQRSSFGRNLPVFCI